MDVKDQITAISNNNTMKTGLLVLTIDHLSLQKLAKKTTYT